MKRILMVVFNTIQNDARVIRAATALHREGYEISIISCNSDPKYLNDSFNSIVFSSKSHGPILLLKFWVYVFLYFLREGDKYSCVYMHDYYMPYIGKLLKQTFHKYFIYDAHELLIQRKTKGYTNREKFFLWLEKKSIQKADLVIAANDERLKIINYIYKLKNSISVGNISELEDKKFVPIDKRENWIVYQGTLSEERNVSTYIKVLRFLPQDIKLKLIGSGPDINNYKTLVDELNLNNRVKFTGRIPYSQLIKESAECRLGIVNYLMDDLNNLYCSPNKLFEYTQCDIPVICSPQPFLIKVMANYHIGEVWDWRLKDTRQLSSIILKILNDPKEYTAKMSKFNEDFTSQKEMKKLTLAVNILLKD